MANRKAKDKAPKAPEVETPKQPRTAEAMKAYILSVIKPEMVEIDKKAEEAVKKLGGDSRFHKTEAQTWQECIDLLADTDDYRAEGFLLEFDIPNLMAYVKANAMKEKEAVTQVENQIRESPHARLRMRQSKTKARKAQAEADAKVEAAKKAFDLMESLNRKLLADLKGKISGWVVDHSRDTINQAKAIAHKGLAKGEKAPAKDVHNAVVHLCRSYLEQLGLQPSTTVGDEIRWSKVLADEAKSLAKRVDPNKRKDDKPAEKPAPEVAEVETQVETETTEGAETAEPAHVERVPRNPRKRKSSGNTRKESEWERKNREFYKDAATPEETRAYLENQEENAPVVPTAMEIAVQQAVTKLDEEAA